MDRTSRDTSGAASQETRWSMATGAVAGLVVATLVVSLFTIVGRRGARSDAPSPSPPPRETAALFQVFRGTIRSAGGALRSVAVLPCGPDGLDEPLLAAEFGSAEEPLPLAGLHLANAGAAGVWDVDLARRPIEIRGEDGAWTPCSLASPTRPLSTAAELRFRALGGGAPISRVAPGTLERRILALPRSAPLERISAVRWGDAELVREQVDLEALRRLRQDPGDVFRPQIVR